jgi:hypothetical protein
MFGTSRTFSLCSECSKAQAVKEMFLNVPKGAFKDVSNVQKASL